MSIRYLQISINTPYPTPPPPKKKIQKDQREIEEIF